MAYNYRLTVSQKMFPFVDGHTQIKKFLGNNKSALMERFEMWVIKQSVPRDELLVILDEVQHIGW